MTKYYVEKDFEDGDAIFYVVDMEGNVVYTAYDQDDAYDFIDCIDIE